MLYKKRKGRKNKRPNEAEFNYNYYTLDMTAKDLAQIYGVKEHTIYNWAAEFRKEEEKRVQ